MSVIDVEQKIKTACKSSVFRQELNPRKAEKQESNGKVLRPAIL